MSTVRRLHLRSSVACAVGFAALAFLPAAHAQEQDAAFKDGIEARDSKKWQEAATHMRRAIAADPKESARKVRTGIFASTEYLPHYFLGEALFNLGACAEAVEAWAISEQQGALTARSEAVALVQKGYGICEGKGVLPPAKYGPLLARTRQQVTEVTSLATSVSGQVQSHLDLWRADMKEQYDRASGELQNAQARLATATRTRLERDFADAAGTAERARSGFKDVQSTLNAAVALHGTAQGLRREIEQALAAADGIDRTLAGKKAVMTPALASAWQAARAAAATARSHMASGPNGGSVAVLTEARGMAQDASARYREVLEGVTRREARTVEMRLAESLAHAEEAFSFIEQGFASLDRLVAEKPDRTTPEISSGRDALRKEYESSRRRFDTAKRTKDLAGLQESTRVAVEMRARQDALISAFGPVTLIDRGVRSALIEGARQFLAGEHAQALATLDPAAVGDGPLQLHVHLLRAAAHYALFVRSGEQDQSQRTQAVAEIDKVKQIDPDFSPDARAFAPRFIAFFQATPAAAVPSSPQEP